MDYGLAGAAVCISGGTRGMGRASAIGFAQQGARVVITGRNRSSLDATVEELRQRGSPDAVGFQCDVSDPENIKSLFAMIRQRWGELNVLVNMAGPLEPQPGADFAEISDGSWSYVYNVGLMSVVRCSREAVPLMRAGGWGRIINVSSISSRTGSPPEAAYMTMKAAVNALTKNMAWGLAKENILVNCLVPGGFYTSAMDEYMSKMDPEQKKYRRGDLHDAARWIADVFGTRSTGVIGRVASPEEIVPFVLLIGSKANTYMVGASVAVDGGTDWTTG